MQPVVLDVNVLVSAVIAPLGIPRQLWEAWQSGRLPLVTSDHIIITTMMRLRLPRIARRYGLGEEDVRLFESSVRAGAVLVTLFSGDIRSVTGDPEDDAVLATARLGHAEYLVTGDHGLLALGVHHTTHIVTPRQFLAVLGN